MRELTGLIPVLITPMTKNNEVDVDALIRVFNHLSNKKVGGFWVLGTGSEDMSLSYEQRLLVAKTISETNSGRHPLIVGCSFFSMYESLRFLSDTRDYNIDAYHAMPYHNLLSLKQIEWWYKELANKAEKPLWLYTSANWAKFIPPSTVEKLRSHPNIVGVKYSTSNAVHAEQVIRLADHQNFQVITAVVRTLFSSLSLGVKAATTVEACAFFNRIIPIYDNFMNGHYDQALSAQRELNAFLDKMPKTPGEDNFLKVAESKYILSNLGLCDEFMSGYYRTLTNEEKSQIDNLVNSDEYK